jgi:hypothetical protein
MSTYYIAQTQQGTGSGADAANAKAVSFFNTSGNWSAAPATSGKISPADTVRLVGTITTALEAQGSGTSGNVITVLFETGSKLSSPCWTTDGGFKVNNKSYITLDGGATGIIGGRDGNPALAVGIVENTANGTGLANSAESCGVYFQESKFCTIQNLVVQNIYVRTGTTDAQDGGRGIRSADANGTGVNDLLITNCIVHDANQGVDVDYGPGDHDYTITYITHYNVNHGVVCGGRGSTSTLTNITIHHIYGYNWNVWNHTTTNNFHHNAVFIFADNNDTVTNPTVHSCFFGPGYGGVYQTSGIYINGGIYNIKVYDNLFLADTGEYASNGFITVDSIKATTILVSNNTLIGGGTTVDGAGMASTGQGATLTYILENNIFQNLKLAVSFHNRANFTLTSNYNTYYSLGASPIDWSTNTSGSVISYVTWTGLGFEANSSTSDPSLDVNYVPQSGSPTNGAGVSLAGSYTLDAAGRTWSANSGWGMGWKQYAGGGGSGTPSTSRQIRKAIALLCSGGSSF